MAMPADYDSFVEDVYETALDPGLWPRLLRRMADMMGARGAALRWNDAFTGIGGGYNSDLDPAVGPLFFNHFVNCNPLRTPPEVMRRRLANWTPRIALGEDWMARDDYVRTEYFNDFAHRFEMDWDLSIGLDAEGDKVGFVNVFRAEADGPHEAANLALAAAAQPHLIRALKLGRRFADPGGLAEGLAAIAHGSPHGLFLLDADGRVRHLNAAAERLASAGAGLRIVGGRMVADGREATRRLDALVGRAARGEAGVRAGGAMSITTPDRRLPLSVIVAPVRAGRYQMFLTGPAALVCVTDLEARATLTEARLRDLFGLTPMEAKVAQALFEGLQPRQAAERLGLSFYTVRGHLAHIFDKTQTTGQADLARLLSRAIGGWEEESARRPE
jgi:DNA-binding CsgD family transcriptional regulator